MAGGLSEITLPLIAASNVWGTWAALLSAAAFGLWAERRTAWGAALSGQFTHISPANINSL